jgi:hypothetical protein
MPPHTVAVLGLLDTASAVNVLPYDVGVQLGAVWAHQTTSVQLTGNLASVPARGLLVSAIVGRFPPVRREPTPSGQLLGVGVLSGHPPHRHPFGGHSNFLPRLDLWWHDHPTVSYGGETVDGHNPARFVN